MHYQDRLSQVFATLRLTSNVYFKAVFKDSFAVEVPPEQRTIRFHLVREGRCWLQVPGHDSVLLETGDLAIVPDGAAQILSSDPSLPILNLSQVLASYPVQAGFLRMGDGELLASMLCGNCSFDESIDHPVLVALPALILLRREGLAETPEVDAALKLLMIESSIAAPGMTGILGRVLEILFIQALRQQPELSRGYISALQDAKLGKALTIV